MLGAVLVRHKNEQKVTDKIPEHKAVMTVAEKHRQADANECDMVSAINNLFDKYIINREYIKENEDQSSIFPKNTDDITQFNITDKPAIVINLNNFIRFSTFTTAATATTITNTLFKQILVLEEICTCLGFTTKLYINVININKLNIRNINAYNHFKKGKQNITQNSNRIGFIQLSTYGIWNVLKKKTDDNTFEQIQFKYKQKSAYADDKLQNNKDVILDSIKRPLTDIIFLFDIIKKTDAAAEIKTQQQVLHSVLTIINDLQDKIIKQLNIQLDTGSNKHMTLKNSTNVNITDTVIIIIKSLIYNILSHKELLHIYNTIIKIDFDVKKIKTFIYTYIEKKLNKYNARHHDNTPISLFTCIKTTNNFYKVCFTESKEPEPVDDEGSEDDEVATDPIVATVSTVAKNQDTTVSVVANTSWGSSE